MASQPMPADDTTTITIEADTVEEALGRLSTELGPGARIVRADRVRKGGIAGFFAREVIEIEAEAPEKGAGVAGAFDRLLAAAESAVPAADPHESAPSPVIARPTLPTPAPSTAPPVMVTVDWDSARMLELGLPGVLVQAVASLDPTDDLGHLTALVAALAPVCGPLPTGPVRLIGDRAVRLRTAVPVDEALTGYLHLVVGDELPESLPGVPAVVSWVTDRGAPRAISLALGTGAKLGFGMGTAFGSPARRISALDAALAIRDLMERT
ncbi:MAG: hypothetical protein ACFCVC_12010 [Acidimicrobiia bacterium]